MIRKRYPAISFIVVVFLIGAMGAPGALAGTTVGSFEIDGNRADDSGPADLTHDWGTPPPGVTEFIDGSGQTDNALGQGSKERRGAVGASTAQGGAV